MRASLKGACHKPRLLEAIRTQGFSKGTITELSKKQHVASGILQVIVAMILLFFKFTGAAESAYIFATLGAEPWERSAAGMVELFAAVVLLMPRGAGFGGTVGARHDQQRAGGTFD